MPTGTTARPRVYGSTLCIVVTLDRDGVVLHASGPGLDASECAPDDVIGRPVDECCAPCSGIVRAARRALAGEVVEDVVEWAGRRWVVWYVPYRDGMGRILGAHGFALECLEDGEAWPLYRVDPMVAPTFERAGVLRPHLPVTAPNRRVGRPPYLRLVD